MGEYRIDWGPGYRLYLAQDGETLIILFGGGIKATQPADIRRAQALFAEYKVRKAELNVSKAASEEIPPWR
jgi:putative addiction module killer protein